MQSSCSSSFTLTPNPMFSGFTTSSSMSSNGTDSSSSQHFGSVGSDSRKLLANHHSSKALKLTSALSAGSSPFEGVGRSRSVARSSLTPLTLNLGLNSRHSRAETIVGNGANGRSDSLSSDFNSASPNGKLLTHQPYSSSEQRHNSNYKKYSPFDRDTKKPFEEDEQNLLSESSNRHHHHHQQSSPHSPHSPAHPHHPDHPSSQLRLLPCSTLRCCCSCRCRFYCGCGGLCDCSPRMGRKINFCLGTILALFTILILVFGSCILAAGIVLVLQLKISSEPFGLGSKLGAREEGGDELIVIVESVAWLCVAVGVLLALVGFSGCTGSFGRVKRDYKVLGKVFLVTFMFLVFLVLMSTLATSISAILLQDSLKSRLRQELKGSMESYRGERSAHPASIFWNLIQLKLDCCGSESADDWGKSANWRRLSQSESNQSWPYVCCRWEGREEVSFHQLDTGGVPRPRYTEWEECYQLDSTHRHRYIKGCAIAVEEVVLDNLIPLSIVVSSLVIACLLCILIAIVLCRHQDYYSVNFLDT